MTADELKEKREAKGAWYAMERKATPGPWAVVEHRTRGTDIRGPNGEAVFRDDKWLEDMALAVHCRNNFGKALGALKAVEAQSLLDYRAGKQTFGMCSTVAMVIQVVKELEEV